jgi:hypothetical protein
MDGFVVLAAGLCVCVLVDDDVDGYGYMEDEKVGGASHTVFRPTTCAETDVNHRKTR